MWIPILLLTSIYAGHPFKAWQASDNMCLSQLMCSAKHK